MKLRAAAIVTVVVGALALPAAAQASNELAISASPSATAVKAGEKVTIKVTVTNRGTEAYENVYVNLFSLRGRGQGANNPYQSVSPSQGVCKDESGPAYGYYYYSFVCEMGPLASGASAQITAVVTVNESMNHLAALLPNAGEGGFTDDDTSNNEAVNRIYASIPPVVTGSKKLKLTGLPAGCFSKDFTLHVTTGAKGVKKMAAVMFLGFNDEGEGQEWKKVTRGNHLVAKVPVSRVVSELGSTYKLKVKAKRGGAKPLEALVTFQLC